MIEKPRSIYRRGAEDGLLMGPLLAAVVVLFGAMPFVAWLLIPTTLLAISVPALTFILLKRSYAEDNGKSSFSALWLHGICIFFFGGLLMAVAAYTAMRWVWPTYIVDMMQLCIETLKATPDAYAIEWGKTLGKAIELGKIPQAADVVVELIYFAVLTGSFLSMVLSMIIRSGRRTTLPPSINN